MPRSRWHEADRYHGSLVAGETRDRYQDSLFADDTREWTECGLTHDEDYNVDTTTDETVKGSLPLMTVEDNTDGIDEDDIVEAATAATASGSLQLTTTDRKQALMPDVRQQPVPVAIETDLFFLIVRDMCGQNSDV